MKLLTPRSLTPSVASLLCLAAGCYLVPDRTERVHVRPQWGVAPADSLPEEEEQEWIAAPVSEEEAAVEAAESQVEEGVWRLGPHIGLSQLRGVGLIGSEGVEIARVTGLIFDAPPMQLRGALASEPDGDGGESFFLPFDGLVVREDGQLDLSSEATSMCLAELRELETAALFRARELETFSGRVGTITVSATDDGETFDVFVLVDDNNERQRVLVAPTTVTSSIPLEADLEVTLEAIRTRDEKGPLLVAAWIEGEAFEVRLRDESGHPTWPREKPRGLRLDDLLDRPLRVAGAEVGALKELLVREEDGQIEFAAIEERESGELVFVRWNLLSRGEGGVLEVDSDAWEGAREARVTPTSTLEGEK